MAEDEQRHDLSFVEDVKFSKAFYRIKQVSNTTFDGEPKFCRKPKSVSSLITSSLLIELPKAKLDFVHFGEKNQAGKPLEVR